MSKLFNSLSQKSIIKYLVAAIIIAVPLYPKFPLFKIPGSQVSIRLEDILILLTSALWLITFLKNPKKYFKNPVIIAMILFWIAGLISILSGIFLTQTVSPLVGFFHWARRIEYMIVLFIALIAINSVSDLKFYIKCILLVIIAAFLYGLGQKYLNWPVITTQNSEYAKGIALRYVKGGHLISTFAGHYDLASYIILTSPLVIVLTFASKNLLKNLNLFKNITLTRGFLFSIYLISLWLLVNSASRISIVSFLGSTSLALIFARKYKAVILVIITSLLFVSFSSNLLTRYMRIFDVTFQKIVEIAVPVVHAAEEVFEDRSTSIRFNVEWPRAIRAFSKNPLLGTGYSSITLATDSDYLRLIGEVGILGALSVLLVFYRIIKKLFKSIPKSSNFSLSQAFTFSILAALPGIFLNMVFIDILEASKFAISFWLLVGLAIKSIKFNKNEK